MENERDHRRADAVKDRRHPREAAEMHIERAERRDHEKIRQDEGPAAGPRAPESAFHVGDENPDLYRERPGQRLRDRDRIAHLLLAQPVLLLHKLFLHEAAQRNRPAETKRAEPQEIEHDLAQRPAIGGYDLLHCAAPSCSRLQA
jgi:hypothetical protein